MNSKQLIGTIIDTTLRIVFIVAAVMLIYKYAMTAYDFGYRVFAEEPVSSDTNARMISISFDDNATTMEIGEALEENGLIEDARLFYVQELLSSYHNKLQPGIYELSSAMTAEEMMAVMAASAQEDAEVSAEDAADTPEEEDTQAGEEAGAEGGTSEEAGENEAAEGEEPAADPEAEAGGENNEP